MIRAAICDDEKNCRDKLENAIYMFFEDRNKECDIKKFSDGGEL